MKFNKLFSSAIILMLLSLSTMSQESDILNRARQLATQKEYTKLLKLLNSQPETTAKSEKLLALKTQALVKLDRLQEALKAAEKRVEVAERKSPWHCLAIVDIAIRLEDMDLAYQWFDRAVDRGFLNPGALEKETLAKLKKDNRFENLMQKINDNIGIGKPVKEFDFKLINGRDFSISQTRGKVILIDFWATWCPPCVKGIPFLKEMYRKYSSSGFEVIAISLDSIKKAVVDYLKKEQIKWPVRYSGEGWMDKTTRLFKVNLIPSYWLIDRKGILRDFGYRLRDKKNLQASIEKLMSEE
jgi:thiol-disulfide isomerase/thioredoxin